MSDVRRLNPERMVRCSVAEEVYCVATSRLRGIQRSEGFSLNETGGPPDGWLTGRRTRIPVFFMAGLLGRPNIAPGRPGAVLIIDRHRDPWGLAVDRALQVVEMESSRLLPIPPAVGEQALGIFQGVVRLTDNLALLVAPERLHPDSPPGSSVPMKPPATQRNTPPGGDTQRAAGHGRLITFSLINGEATAERLVFGLSLAQVSEILEDKPLLRVPRGSPAMLGLVHWRDRVLPVIDVGALIGLPAGGDDTAERLIVCRSPDTGIFFAIPSTADVWGERVPERCPAAAVPQPLDKTFLRGVYAVGSSHLLLLPDLDGIVGSMASSMHGAAA